MKSRDIARKSADPIALRVLLFSAVSGELYVEGATRYVEA